jgi:hypothetical protein
MATSAGRLIGAGVLCLTGLIGSAAAQQSGLVARGDYLARAGDCIACHTAQGGKPYAGGS